MIHRGLMLQVKHLLAFRCALTLWLGIAAANAINTWNIGHQKHSEPSATRAIICPPTPTPAFCSSESGSHGDRNHIYDHHKRIQHPSDGGSGWAADLLETGLAMALYGFGVLSFFSSFSFLTSCSFANDVIRTRFRRP